MRMLLRRRTGGFEDGGTGGCLESSDPNFKGEELVGGVFRLIDKDNDGSLDQTEFLDWFEKSDLRGIMSFKEFYTPISNEGRGGAINETQFVKAMRFFRTHGDLQTLMRSDLSTVCAIIFVIAGLFYVVNEVALAEKIHSDTDVSWRLGEVFVWVGFTIGILGYFRVVLKSVERDCFDSRDRLLAFEQTVPFSDGEERHSAEQADDEGGADNLFLQAINPFRIGKDLAQASVSAAVGAVESSGTVLNKAANTTAKIGDRALATVAGKENAGIFEKTVSRVAQETNRFVLTGSSQAVGSEATLAEGVGHNDEVVDTILKNHVLQEVMQLPKNELQRLWEIGGMGVIIGYERFWMQYCHPRTRYFEVEGRVPPKKPREDPLSIITQWLFDRLDRLRRRFAVDEILFGDDVNETDHDDELLLTIGTTALLSALRELQHDKCTVGRVAKQRPSYWLTLIGLFAMVGRSLNAIIQLATNSPIEPSGWYLVICATGKFLGDCAALLVITQMIQGESRLFVKMRDILLRYVLDEHSATVTPKGSSSRLKGLGSSLRLSKHTSDTEISPPTTDKTFVTRMEEKANRREPSKSGKTSREEGPQDFVAVLPGCLPEPLENQHHPAGKGLQQTRKKRFLSALAMLVRAESYSTVERPQGGEYQVPVWLDDAMRYWLERARKRIEYRHFGTTEFLEPLVAYPRGQRGGVDAHRLEQVAEKAMELEESMARLRKDVGDVPRTSSLASHSKEIFEILDADHSGEVSRLELFDFIEKMGPARTELAREVETLFSRYDGDNTGLLDYEEFCGLLKDVDAFGTPSAVRKKLMTNPVVWCTCLVAVASFCAVMSALLTALMDGQKQYGETDVLPFPMTVAMWKTLDYTKAAFLLVRALVLLMLQVHFFRAQAERYQTIYEALLRDGESFLAKVGGLEVDTIGDLDDEDAAARRIQGLYRMKKAREAVNTQRLTVAAHQRETITASMVMG